MKHIVAVEQTTCDLCNKNDAWIKCLGCGIDICFDCRETKAKKYSPYVYYSGGDGVYCIDCDNRLRKSDDKLHAAYLAIERLRNEHTGWYDDFKKRVEKAQSDLEQINKP